METEMHQILSKSSSAQSCTNVADDEHEDQHTYTSLKDILIVNPSPLPSSSSTHHHHDHNHHDDFDPGAITIKNELLKHAASAYLQSAAILANRNQNFMSRMSQRWQQWQRRQSTATTRWWRDCMHDPLQRCVGFVTWSVGNIISCVTGHVGEPESSSSVSSRRPALTCS